ncbi:hypothetical protein [Sphingomonas echinoides]|uniref:hypothetical protein n=1 Tax=Sphingomonas echinoides TaxID=59803 RepID=UPI0024130E66|nr:hypothetical protein [Sphingomonas echinoides]
MLLSVTCDAGTFRIGQRYTLLTAAGGVIGTYTLVQTPVGGTEFRPVQNANDIAVDLARTGASLATLAQTGNQAAVAGALRTLGVANTAYATLTLNPHGPAGDRPLLVFHAVRSGTHVWTATSLHRRTLDVGTSARNVPPLQGGRRAVVVRQPRPDTSAERFGTASRGFYRRHRPSNVRRSYTYQTSTSPIYVARIILDRPIDTRSFFTEFNDALNVD